MRLRAFAFQARPQNKLFIAPSANSNGIQIHQPNPVGAHIPGFADRILK
jgi:hypothetical protein